MIKQKLTKKEIREWEMKDIKDGYIHRVLVSFDIFCNVVIGGDEDETISSHVRRISDANPGFSLNPLVILSKLINFGLNIIQPDHGQKAEVADLERAKEIMHIENKTLHPYIKFSDRLDAEILKTESFKKQDSLVRARLSGLRTAQYLLTHHSGGSKIIKK